MRDICVNAELLVYTGKMAVLKTSNSILRKLSKSCDTEFCGRILMFLAAVYPLSEPSALNLSAKVSPEIAVLLLRKKGVLVIM